MMVSLVRGVPPGGAGELPAPRAAGGHAGAERPAGQTCGGSCLGSVRRKGRIHLGVAQNSTGVTQVLVVSTFGSIWVPIFEPQPIGFP